ncbi:hypothetical protein BT69DRAFT_1298617 [Atractiella rhizophila]|nr:hypothetical protein BT69DRAFT_1298617 [Atractiella rhizophila]
MYPRIEPNVNGQKGAHSSSLSLTSHRRLKKEKKEKRRHETSAEHEARKEIKGEKKARKEKRKKKKGWWRSGEGKHPEREVNNRDWSLSPIHCIINLQPSMGTEGGHKVQASKQTLLSNQHSNGPEGNYHWQRAKHPPHVVVEVYEEEVLFA